MKRALLDGEALVAIPFSALGRAVWDETVMLWPAILPSGAFSALGRAVWDETCVGGGEQGQGHRPFSALGRAVWDETPIPRPPRRNHSALSVLSVEPYGMKQPTPGGDDADAMSFQCSRSSRMG